MSPPPTVSVSVGQTFIINCTTLGVPTPEIVWRLNWGCVPEKCTMSSTPQDGNRAFGELICPNAQDTDQGAYSCESINIKGSCFAGSTGMYFYKCFFWGQPIKLVQVASTSELRENQQNDLLFFEIFMVL